MRLIPLLLFVVAMSCVAAPPAGECTRARPESVGEVLVTPRAPQPPVEWTLGRQFDHVLVVVLENKSYDDVMAHPYFRGLAGRGALFTRFNGLFHPSYANYLAMVGGRHFPTSDHKVTRLRDAPSIADLFDTKGLSWRQYAEGFPGQCSLAPGSKETRYTVRHVPFLSFESITSNPKRCRNIMSGEGFDPENLPNYALYVPDLCRAGHDKCGMFSGRLNQSAEWLDGFLAPLLKSPDIMRHTLVVVTFDESSDQTNNHVYTVFLGAGIVPGTRVDDCYDHYNVLRTIEDNFKLGTLGGEDARSAPIVSVFRAGRNTRQGASLPYGQLPDLYAGTR